MKPKTRELWDKQDQHKGDRHRLFTAIGNALEIETALYPGSYVDLAPSFVWRSVTYVDVDKRAERFFADTDGVSELLTEHGADPTRHTARFIRADYSDDLALEEESFDLLISLYAGFVSSHCTKYLRRGGFLLVNSSHGDAGMASLQGSFELRGAVVSREGEYSVNKTDLHAYLIPKRDIVVTEELLHETGRGVAYTKSPFAYLFERVS